MQMSWFKLVASFILAFLLGNAVFGDLFFVGEVFIGGMK